MASHAIKLNQIKQKCYEIDIKTINGSTQSFHSAINVNNAQHCAYISVCLFLTSVYMFCISNSHQPFVYVSMYDENPNSNCYSVLCLSPLWLRLLSHQSRTVTFKCHIQLVQLCWSASYKCVRALGFSPVYAWIFIVFHCIALVPLHEIASRWRFKLLRTCLLSRSHYCICVYALLRAYMCNIYNISVSIHTHSINRISWTVSLKTWIVHTERAHIHADTSKHARRQTEHQKEQDGR